MLCRIGVIEIWRALDLYGPFLAPEELFPTAGRDVAHVIETHVPGGVCAKTGGLLMPVQGFLLKTPDHVILIDTCVGNHKTAPSFPDWHQRDDTRFLAGLTAAGIGPGDVDYVLCTHLHVDHVGWNTQLVDGRWVPTFPNAKYLLPKADEPYYRENAQAMYQESILPVVEAGQAEFVEGAHALGDHVTLMPTPGHTAGHVSVLIKDGSKEAIITGDAIHSAAQCWHPEWHFKFDQDAEQAVASRRALLEAACEADRRVLGTHFQLPSIGRVRAKGDVFAWDDDV
ncbi:MBL fold metallo-hydrolase [Roseovarius phycicola]|uniref:MBL fold metallo-hydrolase n=1 Tax=Roseovarius phycicola TaxID=3080976 RepID=A0ABZ2HJD6_9RHOB